MNLQKFNPKKVKALTLGKKYNIETTKGEYLAGVLGRSCDSDDAEYFFSGDFGLYDIAKVTNIAPYIEFSYVAVDGGFVLTKNGSKCFRENIHGIIDNEDYVKHYIHYMNINANKHTPDTIKRSDIVQCIDKLFYCGEKAIVVNVIKPSNLEDHGCIEVYMLDSRIFEHFTYTGWNEFLKVVEEY